MRPIDADALKESLQQSYCKLVEIYQKHQDGKTKAQLIAFKEAILRTKDQPTLDVEPVRHGRWEWYEEPYDSRNPDGDYGWRCSECKQDLANELTLGIPHMHYAYDILDDPDTPPTLGRCVFCGAKMDAKEE